MPTLTQINKIRDVWEDTPICSGSLVWFAPFSGPDGESIEYYSPVVALIKAAGFPVDHSERFVDVVPDTVLDKNGDVDWLSYYEAKLLEEYGLTREMLDKITDDVDEVMPYKQDDVYDVAMQAILSFGEVTS